MKSTDADGVNNPVWHRLAADMARDGHSSREIADEFLCGVDDAKAFVDEFGPADRRRSKAHAERMRRCNADPEFAAARDERMRLLNAEPAFRARLGRLPKGLPRALADTYRALRAEIGREAALRQLLDEGDGA